MMIIDGEKRYFTAIKNILGCLSLLNGTHKEVYHFCMNCLNGFPTAWDKHYEYCSSLGHVRVEMPFKKEKWLKFHNGQ